MLLLVLVPQAIWDWLLLQPPAQGTLQAQPAEEAQQVELANQNDDVTINATTASVGLLEGMLRVAMAVLAAGEAELLLLDHGGMLEWLGGPLPLDAVGLGAAADLVARAAAPGLLVAGCAGGFVGFEAIPDESEAAPDGEGE
jgi:hypothetical protein